jgi:hypothetical protein
MRGTFDIQKVTDEGIRDQQAGSGAGVQLLRQQGHSLSPYFHLLFAVCCLLSTVCCLLLITKFLDTEYGFTYIPAAFIEQSETFKLFLIYRSISDIDLRRIG